MTALTPGIHHGVAMTRYLDRPTGDAPCIGASGLAAIEGQSPAHYYAYADINSQPAARDETPALRLGTAAHKLILEGTLWGYMVKPDGFDGRTKAGKAWLANVPPDHQVITQGELTAIFAMRDALTAHPMARKLLERSAPEVTAVWQETETGFLKARPDALSRDPGQLPWAVNLKTCESAKPEDFEKAIWNYKYNWSAALTVRGLKALQWHDSPGYAFVAVEKAPPHAVMIYTLKPEVLSWTNGLIDRAYTRWMLCMESKNWPAYGDTPQEIGLPPWAEKRMAMQATDNGPRSSGPIPMGGQHATSRPWLAQSHTIISGG